MKPFLTMKLILILALIGVVQRSEEVHLSLNLYEADPAFKKKISENGDIDFYVNFEHFFFKKNGHQIEEVEEGGLAKLNLLDIDSFLQLDQEIRKKSIEESEKEGVLKILTNDQMFERIYLYEKRGSKIFRYKVIWVEEIE